MSLNLKLDVILSDGGKNRDRLTRNQCYIALITKDFLKDEKCQLEARDAGAMNNPMYALVEKRLILPKEILELPWKQILYYSNTIEFQGISAQLLLQIAQDDELNDKIGEM